MSAIVRRSCIPAWIVALAVSACTHPEGVGLVNNGAGAGNDPSIVPGAGQGGSGNVNTAGNTSVSNGGSTSEGNPNVGTIVDGNIDGPRPEQVPVCLPARYQDTYTPGQNQPPAPSDADIQSLLNRMDVGERIKQLQGVDVDLSSGERYNDIQRSEHTTLLDGTQIRGYFYRDAGRGVNLDARQEQREYVNNYATLFPVASARGASFDLDLEYRIGEAIADETVASQNTMLLAPCMNILRHPYWGRAQETYGEDVYHLGRMSSALTAGLQTNVVACAKHFAANNIENQRAANNAVLDEQTLREIYGRHFEMVIEEGGIGCIMAAYNSINGVKSTQNQHLLTEILRNDFGFQGLVISDWWAMPGDQGPVQVGPARDQAAQALVAGLDIEVPWTLHYGQLDELLNDGDLTIDQINLAAGRILRQKARFNALYLDEPIGLKPPTTTMVQGSISNNAAHIELAREAAVKSMVLVKNAGSLPIAAGIDTIAVVGPQRNYVLQSTTGMPGTTCANAGGSINCSANFATEIMMGDRGSSRVNPDPALTMGPAAGLTQLANARGIQVVSGNDATVAAGANVDFVVVMVGLTPGDEGEEYAIPAGGDRSTLTLPDNQDALVQQVAQLGKPMVVVIEAGGIINMPWLDAVPSVVMAWYPGQQGGLALAQLLFGEENFSAKLPVAWPREQDLPPFKDSATQTAMGYFLGYRYFDENNITPIFPFGHGLSYSSFTYANLTLGCPDTDKQGVIPVSVDVTNTSAVPGVETVFVFASFPQSTARRSHKELKGFKRVTLAANETKPVTIHVRVQDLKYWQGDAAGSWVIESGPVDFLVGRSANEAELLKASVNVL